MASPATMGRLDVGERHGKQISQPRVKCPAYPVRFGNAASKTRVLRGRVMGTQRQHMAQVAA